MEHISSRELRRAGNLGTSAKVRGWHGASPLLLELKNRPSSGADHRSEHGRGGTEGARKRRSKSTARSYYTMERNGRWRSTKATGRQQAGVATKVVIVLLSWRFFYLRL
jgi:hypothetical protein